MDTINDLFQLLGRMTPDEAYRELGVKPGTPLDEIKKRYRQLSLERHPDRNPGKGDEAMKRLNDAWDTIQQVVSRGGYGPAPKTQKQEYDPGTYYNPPIFGDDGFTIDTSPKVIRFYRTMVAKNDSRVHVPFMEFRAGKKQGEIEVVFDRESTPEDVLTVLEEHMKGGSKSYSRRLDTCTIEDWPAWLITQGLNGTENDWLDAFGEIPERPPTDEEDKRSWDNERRETLDAYSQPAIQQLIKDLDLSVATEGFGNIEIQWINPATTRRMSENHDASVLMKIVSGTYQISNYIVDPGGSSARSSDSKFTEDPEEAAQIFREYVEQQKARTSDGAPMYQQSAIYAALQDPQIRKLIRDYNLEWSIRDTMKRGESQGMLTWVNYSNGTWNTYAVYPGSLHMFIRGDNPTFSISERAETAEGNMGWNDLYSTDDLNAAVQEFRRLVEERSSNRLDAPTAGLREVLDFFEDM